MRFVIAIFAAILASALAMPANAQDRLVADVKIYERVELGRAGTIVPVAIARDTRCSEEFYCSDPGTLVVAVVLQVGGQKRAGLIELGRPVVIDGGYLTLVGTTTRAKDGGGGIPLRDYRLDFVFEPFRGG